MFVIWCRYLFGSFEVFFIYVYHVFERVYDFFEVSLVVVSQFIGVGRGVLWQEVEVFWCFEDIVFFEIVVWEVWFGIVQVRVVGLGFV